MHLVSCFETGQREMTETIFERYGGFAAIRRVVSDFYDRALDSPVISHHFEHVDMKRLLDHQARFVSSLTGGPASYTDDHLRRVHERLGITLDEFREMLGPGVNMAARMEELAEPMQILVSSDTHGLIKDDFEFADLGELEVKGFGTQRVYGLVGEGVPARR